MVDSYVKQYLSPEKINSVVVEEYKSKSKESGEIEESF